ncbi:8187_t:CDS:10 [Ambispora leptoticha]|uniref:8187_t:CDS:1 n=1 Tax=Ambispora leptoticha TaxID=144679 RepID=A0A9N8WKF2_9GLOM|nr:8187_t:CDS:10 [Ambispora leptoticha]
MTIKLLENDAIQKLRSSFTITSLTHCLDASATAIEIHVDVPNYFLQVLDNGCGISPEDLQKIGQRYFTSRCSTLEDLQRAITYGFRGEALASISEVALLEIISKHPNYFDGYSVVLKDGKSIRHHSIRMTKGKQPGTIVIIRDLFYVLPVRRKRRSADSIANELENLKRGIEIHALIHSNVTFTLVDSSQNIKLLFVKKTTSIISRFRQLFGVPLAQDLEYVFAEQGDLKINGFVSMRGYHTKQYQYVYVNGRFISYNVLYKTIETVFVKSNFYRDSEIESLYDSRSEKHYHHHYHQNYHPIFLLHITCPKNYYEICLDPLKNIIEFKDWSEIIDLLSALIEKFLITFGFLEKKSRSHSHNPQCNKSEDDPIVAHKKSFFTAQYHHDRSHSADQKLLASFKDMVHAKSGSSNSNINSIPKEKKIFEDKELKGAHIIVGDVNFSDLATIKDKVAVVPLKKSISESSQQNNIDSENKNKNSLNFEKTNEHIKWTDPITKHTFYIDNRTGNSYENLPSNNNHNDHNNAKKDPSSCAKVDRRFLRTSMNFQEDKIDGNEDAMGSCSNWVKEKFKKWSNPIFKNTEAPLPSLSSSNLDNYNFRSLDNEYWFTKQEIQRAEVIGQVDGKFIACKIPHRKDHEEGKEEKIGERGKIINDSVKSKNKIKQILVLVDQHAADERIRVEMLLKELCTFKIDDKKIKDADSDKFSSIIDTAQLKSPIKIVLSQREAQAAQRFARYFNEWGIFYDGDLEKSEDIHSHSTSVTPKATSIHNNSNKTAYTLIYITHLPEAIVDRCIADTRITQDLIRRHLFWLEENCDGIGVSLEDIVTGLQQNDDVECDKKWSVILRTCPKGILDILNSKACRGAIMFNDLLELDQCKRLVQKLVTCVFPFQCAHGRPSMIPIMALENYHHRSKISSASQITKIVQKFNK